MSNLPRVEVTNHTLGAGQSVTTNTSPNSLALAIASGDANNQTGVAFQFQGRITYWNPGVSTGYTTIKLANDTGNAVVTWKAGLTVTYSPQTTGLYNVLLDGEIVDSGSVYVYTGFVLASFTSNSQ
ncbi:MAG: hypothetical protein RR376_13215 [Janthinobacterium sp.]